MNLRRATTETATTTARPKRFKRPIDQAQLANADPHLVARLWVYLAEGEEAQGDYPSARQCDSNKAKPAYAKTTCLQARSPFGCLQWKGLLLSRADKGERAVSVLQKVIKDGESLPDGGLFRFRACEDIQLLGNRP